MYGHRLEELRKEKGLSHARWAEESGISIDTIRRIVHQKESDTYSPSVSVLEDLCKPLGVELWEIFYIGSTSIVALQAEITSLKSERDTLVANNAVLGDTVEKLRDKVDSLKDELIYTHRHYNKLKNTDN